MSTLRRAATRLTLVTAAVLALAGLSTNGPPAHAQTQTPATPVPAAPAAVFNRYCVTCHNSRLKTAGLVIDPADLNDPGANPELWEKVVRKLRSSAMPPAGAPRPDQGTYDAVASFLETELDRAAGRTDPDAGDTRSCLTRRRFQPLLCHVP